MTVPSSTGRAMFAAAAALLAAAGIVDAASAKTRSSERTSIKVDVDHTPTIKHDTKRNKLVVNPRYTIKDGKKVIASSRSRGYSIDCKTIKVGKWLDCGSLSDLF